MANLAIKGHIKHGWRTIKILEMLGGVNQFNLDGNTDAWYVLTDTRVIRWSEWTFDEKGFTVEEFFEKFPYKIGDRVKKVNDDDGYCATVISMDWDSVTSEVIYTIIFDDHIGSTLECLSIDLQPCKEEIFGEIELDSKTFVDGYDQGYDDGQHDMTEWNLPDGFIFKDENGNVINTNKIVLEKKKSKYPKTYEECSLINGCDNRISLKIIGEFIRLINARNAYWNIAGEQMGLGKPWSPSKNDDVYCIFRLEGEIVKDNFVFADSLILEFPTEEMRDAFYENFKELIEQCKELL